MSKKHSWSKEDNKICSESYLKGLKPYQTHLLLPHISLNSINMKYGNCKFLEKGQVPGVLCNATNVHKDVWKSITEQKKIPTTHYAKDTNVSNELEIEEIEEIEDIEELNEFKKCRPTPMTRTVSAEENGAFDYGSNGSLVRYVDGKLETYDDREKLDEVSFRKKIAEKYGESIKIDEDFINYIFGKPNPTIKKSEKKEK